MNLSVDDEQSFDVTLARLTERHGRMRVLRAMLWQLLSAQRGVPVPLGLNAHLRRDVGLPPDD